MSRAAYDFEDAEYRERLYAGILGKIIGVYLGRPFENWSSQKIAERLGDITYYVNERMNVPLVVTDDDLSGTFTFIHALEDDATEVTPQAVGRAWLNYIIEGRTTLWWGGRGTSTEHTAYLNLQDGRAAPVSGSARTNGRLVAEQIGAQIFIDGWALVNPGDPDRAAAFARSAAQVSHDGASVDAAVLWAAMEAEAFRSADIGHLLDTGLRYLGSDSTITSLVHAIAKWAGQSNDWRETLARIQHDYGYDKFGGGCHVVPNHALMIMTLLHAGTDFDLAQHIVNTSGWDTDCNAGNVGCFIGIARGLSAFDGQLDWRGPIADRCLISSARGTGATDAVRLTDYVESLARRHAGLPARAPEKRGAQFHFSLPGSVQGFQVASEVRDVGGLRNENGALVITCENGREVTALTPTFVLHDPLHPNAYNLESTPQVNPGQRLFGAVTASGANRGDVEACLRVQRYGARDGLEYVSGPMQRLAPGETADLSWVLPDDGFPIAAVGVAFFGAGSGKTSVSLDHLGYGGSPKLRLRRPMPRDGETAWRRAFVHAVSNMSDHYAESYRISQNRGTGLLIYGGHDWSGYRVSTRITPHHCRSAGVAMHVCGLRRYLAVRLSDAQVAELILRWDDDETVLARHPIRWRLDEEYAVELAVRDNSFVASIDGHSVSAVLPKQAPASGGLALMVTEGALSADEIVVS